MGQGVSKPASRNLLRVSKPGPIAQRLKVPANRSGPVVEQAASGDAPKDGNDPQESNFTQMLSKMAAARVEQLDRSQWNNFSPSHNDKLIQTLTAMQARTEKDELDIKRVENKTLFPPGVIVAIVRDLQANERRENILANYKMDPAVLHKLAGLEALKVTGIGQRRKAAA